MDRGGVAAVEDASEAYAVCAAAGVGELADTVSTRGELFVADSVVVSTAVGLGERSVAASMGGALVVADSAAGVFAAAGLAEPCTTISIGGGELFAADCAIAGVGDAATDEVFGPRVTPRISKTSTRPVNTASVPKRICFARETGRACGGIGDGTTVDRGGAPHEGQAVANELISLPHS